MRRKAYSSPPKSTDSWPGRAVTARTLPARGSGPPTGVTGAITGTDVVMGCSFGSGPLALTIAGAREATAQP